VARELADEEVAALHREIAEVERRRDRRALKIELASQYEGAPSYFLAPFSFICIIPTGATNY
jgi:hypothetical protein